MLQGADLEKSNKALYKWGCLLFGSPRSLSGSIDNPGRTSDHND